MQTPTPPSPSVKVLPLEVKQVDWCAGTGTAAILKGAAEDPEVAWIEPFPFGGARTPVVWPLGYMARFAPDLEIIDGQGRVVLRAGDFVDGICDQDGRTAVLAPPFLALRLECGPMSRLRCQIAVHQVAVEHGWPERQIGAVTFVDGTGKYEVLFEDGTAIGGSIHP